MTDLLNLANAIAAPINTQGVAQHDLKEFYQAEQMRRQYMKHQMIAELIKQGRTMQQAINEAYMLIDYAHTKLLTPNQRN